MRVMVTGGTGFVGAHTVAELIRSGHDMHLLVRDPDRIGPALEPLGISDLPSYSVGDVSDAKSVEAAMQGCDAVVHSASVYSFDVRQENAIRNTNVTGTDIVLGAAHKLGLDPIVHVSSIAALVPPEGEVLSPNTVPKYPAGVYMRSKADSERVAREYQAKGAPVVITYPGAVWGPHDPHWGEGPQTIANILNNPMNMFPPGGIPVVDVRDVAKVHTAVMEKGKGPRRYMTGGNYHSIANLTKVMSDVTGRSVRLATMPAWSLLPVVQLAHGAQKLFRIKLPISKEPFVMVKWDIHCDDTSTKAELGIEYRDVQDTLTDMIIWMHASGGLSAKKAGKLAF